MTSLTKLTLALSLFGALPALAQPGDPTFMVCHYEPEDQFLYVARTYALTYSDNDQHYPRKVGIESVVNGSGIFPLSAGTMTADLRTGIPSFSFSAPYQSYGFTVEPTEERLTNNGTEYLIGRATIGRKPVQCYYRANFEPLPEELNSTEE